MGFRPKPSHGWMSLVALGVVMLLSAWLLGLGSNVHPLGLLFAVPTALLGLWALYLATLFPTMRYELTAEEVRLRYGPMCWSVPLADIRAVRKADLGWTIWSSWRFPGFALFNVPYAGVGNVRMCSTRCIFGVTLIETDDARYGISPDDEEGFLEAMAALWAGVPETGEDPNERASDG